MHFFNRTFTRLVEDSGRSQKELAEALALSESAIVNYKRDRIPKAEELLRIARHFGVTMESLLTDEAPASPRQTQTQSQRLGRSPAEAQRLAAELLASAQALARELAKF